MLDAEIWNKPEDMCLNIDNDRRWHEILLSFIQFLTAVYLMVMILQITVH